MAERRSVEPVVAGSNPVIHPRTTTGRNPRAEVRYTRRAFFFSVQSQRKPIDVKKLNLTWREWLTNAVLGKTALPFPEQSTQPGNWGMGQRLVILHAGLVAQATNVY
jgi:hypothetical protein